MTTKAVDIGDRERLSVTFTDINSTLISPSLVSVTVLEPDGTSTTYGSNDPSPVVLEQSTGIFYMDYTYDQAGRHFFQFDGTGVLVASVAGERWARRSNV